MDGNGPSDKRPFSVSEIRSLSLNQLWWLLWAVLVILQEFTTNPDPCEGTGNLPQWAYSGPVDATAATSSAASSTANPAPPPVPVVPLQPFTCQYRCIYCSAWCSRAKPGHRHHRCRSHHDY